MDKNHNEKVLDGLRYALDNQIKWQHFAEAKNLCLLTISGASLLLLVNSLQNLDKDLSVQEVAQKLIFDQSLGMTIFTLATIVSLIISIASFILRGNRKHQQANRNKLLFISWKFINKSDKDTLYDKASEYGIKAQIDDVLSQHILGSRITAIKYRHFNYGIKIYILGLISFLFASLL